VGRTGEERVLAGRRERLRLVRDDDARRTAAAAQSPVEVGVRVVADADDGAVDECDVVGDDGVEGEAVRARVESVAAASSMSADADLAGSAGTARGTTYAAASAMGDAPLALLEEAESDVAEALTAADGRYAGRLVDIDALEPIKRDGQGASVEGLGDV